MSVVEWSNSHGSHYTTSHVQFGHSIVFDVLKKRQRQSSQKQCYDS